MNNKKYKKCPKDEYECEHYNKDFMNHLKIGSFDFKYCDQECIRDFCYNPEGGDMIPDINIPDVYEDILEELWMNTQGGTINEDKAELQAKIQRLK